MNEQRKETIPQILDRLTYHCGQSVVTAAVQFCESGKTSFVDNKQNRKTQYLGSKEAT